MVKYPSKDMKKEITSTIEVAVDQRKHVVSHQQCVWEHSISALLQASNLLPSCCQWSLRQSVQLFSLDFPLLCIPSIFEVHSVWNDAMHSSVKPAQISSCPGWFTYGKFGILATANKSRLWLAIACGHHNLGVNGAASLWTDERVFTSNQRLF